MFVAEQQLTSLSPRREILCNQYIGDPAGYCVLAGKRRTQAKEWALTPPIMRFQKRSVRRARGCAAELSVARSTMRVNSPVPAVRRMLSFSALGFEFVFLPSLSELLGGAWPRRVAAHLFYQALVLSSTRHSAIKMNICKFVYLNYWFQGTNMLY